MINLLDFLKLKKLEIVPSEAKIHCATGSIENPPILAFYNDKFKEWQEYQTKKNFQLPYIISIIHLKNDQWLFAGIYKVNGEPRIVKNNIQEHFEYQTELLENQEDFLGKLIISFDKKFRASYLLAENYLNKLEISQILEQRMSIEEFPGFNKVCVSFQKLKTIINKQEESWKGALINIKGIYLITDTTNGKLYIGSATGLDGIWGRWSSYAKDGHGGNIELKNILKSDPKKYEHFQYTLLEIADTHASDNDILLRECFWKNALLSRSFGYNKN